MAAISNGPAEPGRGFILSVKRQQGMPLVGPLRADDLPFRMGRWFATKKKTQLWMVYLSGFTR